MKIALIILILQGLLSCDFLNKSKSNSSSSSSSKPIFLSATRSWEVGSQHCLIDNGKTYCWGPGHANGFNTTGNELIPTLIPRLPEDAIQVANDESKTCILFEGGSVRCLGTDMDPSVAIVSSGATKIAVNYSVSCAIINSALKCWGLNTYGLLGDGTGFDSNTPVDVVGMDSGVTDVSVGLRTVCAIKSGGAYCWGDNSGGQLGNGSTTPSIVPVQVSGLTTGVTAISAGYGSWGLQGDSVFAIKDGALYRWGKNDFGQLGNGFTADMLTPELVPELSTNVTSVDTDGIAACAIKDGEVWCFGISAFLRGIPFDGLSYSPSKVEGVNGTPVQISMGKSRACVSLTDEVYCWGFNGDGTLDPSTNDIPSPVLIYSR